MKQPAHAGRPALWTLLQCGLVVRELVQGLLDVSHPGMELRDERVAGGA